MYLYGLKAYYPDGIWLKLGFIDTTDCVFHNLLLHQNKEKFAEKITLNSQKKSRKIPNCLTIQHYFSCNIFSNIILMGLLRVRSAVTKQNL